MSQASRLLEIMAAAGLADKDLEKERIRAARDAAATTSWTNALGQSAAALGDIGSKSYAEAAKTNLDEANDYVLSKAGTVGDLKKDDERPVFGPEDRPLLGPEPETPAVKAPKEANPFQRLMFEKTPEEEARKQIGDEESLKPKETVLGNPSENFFTSTFVNPFENFFNSTFVNPIREGGARAAKNGLAGQIRKDREALQTSTLEGNKAFLDYKIKQADQEINRGKAGEDSRHNKATEGHQGSVLGETSRHNKATEANDKIKADAAAEKAAKATNEISKMVALRNAYEKEVSGINWGLANMAYATKEDRAAATARRNQLMGMKQSLDGTISTLGAVHGIEIPGGPPAGAAPAGAPPAAPAGGSDAPEPYTDAQASAAYDKFTPGQKSEFKALMKSGVSRRKAAWTVANGK